MLWPFLQHPLSLFSLLALTPVYLASDLFTCLFLVLIPNCLLLVCYSLTLSTLSHESMRGGDGENGSGEREGRYSRQREKHMGKSGNSRELDALRAVVWAKL